MRSPLHHNRNPDSDSGSDSGSDSKSDRSSDFDSDVNSDSESDTISTTSRAPNKDQTTDNSKAKMSSDESTSNQEMNNQDQDGQDAETTTENGQRPHVSTKRNGGTGDISIQNIENEINPKQKTPEKSVSESLMEAKAELELVQIRIELERKKIQLAQLTQNGSMITANTDNPATTATASFNGSNSLLDLSQGGLMKMREFRGTTPEEVDMWFRQLHYWRTKLQTSDQEILNEFSQLITNEDLRRWWKTSAADINTLEAAQKEMRYQCTDNTMPHVAASRAVRMSQRRDEKVDKFILRAKEAFGRIYPRLLDTHLPIFMWTGLGTELKKEVRMKSGMTMREFVEECRAAESVIHTRVPKNTLIQRNKRNVNENDDEEEKWCDNCQRSTHSTEDCWSKGKPRPQRMSTASKRSKDSDDDDDSKKRTKLTCHKCNGNHVASQCPNK